MLQHLDDLTDNHSSIAIFLRDPPRILASSLLGEAQEEWHGSGIGFSAFGINVAAASMLKVSEPEAMTIRLDESVTRPGVLNVEQETEMSSSSSSESTT